jgi:hypothetical protein
MFDATMKAARLILKRETQACRTVRPDDRVRVAARAPDPERVVGRLSAIDSVALYVEEDRTHQMVRMSYSAITIVERSRGFARGRRALAGAGMGLAAGVLAGVIQVSTSQGNDPSLAPVGFGFYGMQGGAAFGAIAAPERWQEIHMSRPDHMATPRRP